MEELKNELLRKKIIITYEEWYALNELAFMVSNKCNPKDLYAEYVEEIVTDYAKRKNIK
jgi:hypothetical protein